MRSGSDEIMGEWVNVNGPVGKFVGKDCRPFILSLSFNKSWFRAISTYVEKQSSFFMFHIRCAVVKSTSKLTQ